MTLTILLFSSVSRNSQDIAKYRRTLAEATKRTLEEHYSRYDRKINSKQARNPYEERNPEDIPTRRLFKKAWIQNYFTTSTRSCVISSRWNAPHNAKNNFRHSSYYLIASTTLNNLTLEIHTFKCCHETNVSRFRDSARSRNKTIPKRNIYQQ